MVKESSLLNKMEVCTREATNMASSKVTASGPLQMEKHGKAHMTKTGSMGRGFVPGKMVIKHISPLNMANRGKLKNIFDSIYVFSITRTF